MSNEEKKHGTEGISKLMKKTASIGKKAAGGAKTGIASVVEKSKAVVHSRKLQKYNPVFPDQFNSKDFNLPNIIMIVDDAVRRGIDVCEGAIGWLDKEANVEIMCLYDEAVSFSGLVFIPAATCDGIYYVDSFDRTRFIRTDCIFAKAHEERIAELENIAYSLGAKKCTIEIQEYASALQSQSSEVECAETYKGITTTEKSEKNLSQAVSNHRSGRIIVEFEGHDAPVRPVLKWFAHDNTINQLIDMCCNGNRAVKTKTLELFGSSSATMNIKTAKVIDGAIGKIGGAKGKASMNSLAEKEHNSKLYFHLEF